MELIIGNTALAIGIIFGLAALGTGIGFGLLGAESVALDAADGAVVNDPVIAGLDCTAAGLPAPTCSA